MAGSPRGESTFLHLIVRPWNLTPFFQMASAAAANWADPASFDLPSYPIQPKQPSHYWLQLFETGNLIPARPSLETNLWGSLVETVTSIFGRAPPALGKHPNWFTVNRHGGRGVYFLVFFFCCPEHMEHIHVPLSWSKWLFKFQVSASAYAFLFVCFSWNICALITFDTWKYHKDVFIVQLQICLNAEVF